MNVTKKKLAIQGFPVFFKIIFSLVICLTTLSCSVEKSDISSENKCDILIVGGGIGGVAAALQACSMAEEWGIDKIILTEETSWPGGQYTSQGVTASDDNYLVEQGKYNVGASKLYFRFHETIRDLYRPKALETAEKSARTGKSVSARNLGIEMIKGTRFSPGNAWGSRMSFLPEDGVKAIDIMISPYREKGLLSVRYRTVPVEVFKDGDRVTGVRFRSAETGEETVFYAAITLDATELGDLLPLAGIDYRVGIEASGDTGEPSLFDDTGKPLYPEPMTDCVQSFTYTFAVEWRPPKEDNRLPWVKRPSSYGKNRHRFTMTDKNRWFLMTRWNDFAAAQMWEENLRTGENKPIPWIPSFWTYRRMLDARYINPDIEPDLLPRFINGRWKTDFDPGKDPQYFIPNWQHNPPGVGDIIEVNWISNDFNGETIIDIPLEKREKVLTAAKELSLAFLFWLWYEAPRDPRDPKADPSLEKNWSVDPVTGKNRGYASLKFRPDVMGTVDGLSMFPYIRESRRMRALFTVKQQHLMAPRTSRAQLFNDTVGIGHYFLDIHRCDEGCERKRDINFKHVQLSDGSFAGENASGRFQIPFGSLVPAETDDFLAAAKNIGLTRIAASTYRLHPVEFEIGKAAGAAAVMCVAGNFQPRELFESEKHLRRLQYELLRAGTPLFWNEDCGWDTDIFEAVQWVCLLEIMKPHGRVFEPDKPLTRAEAESAVNRLSGQKVEVSKGQPEAVTEAQFLKMLAPVLETGMENGTNQIQTRGKAAVIIYREIAGRYELPVGE